MNTAVNIDYEHSLEAGRYEYDRTREKYLALCRKYGFNPFDLDILNISLGRLPRRDKVLLVRYILRLIRLERLLKERVAPGLFPLTVRESERSGYLVPTIREDNSSH